MVCGMGTQALTKEPCEELVEVWIPTPKDSDSLGPGWSLRTCLSHGLCSVAAAAVRATCGEHWPGASSSLSETDDKKWCWGLVS